MAVGDNVGDTVFFGLEASILLVMAVWIVQASMQCDWSKHLCAAHAAVSNAIRAWRGAKEEGEEDDMRRVVRSKVEQQKVQHFTRTCACLCLGYGMGTLFNATKIAMGQERNVSVVQEVALIIVQGTLAVILLRPALVTSKSIDAFYASITLGAAVYVSPFACDHVLMVQSISAFDFGLTVLVVSRRSLAVTVPTTFIYAASSSATLWTHGGSCVATPQNLATGHFFLVMGLPIAGFLIDVAMRALLRQGIEMENAKELLGAACAVLRSVCDVVVELDASGVITGPAYDLGVLLLKGSGFRCNGRRLADFLSSDEDKRMFEERINPDKAGSAGLADALHVRMKDGDKNLVRVELFSFMFRHLDSQPRFMVGLREFADNGAVAGQPQRPAEGSDEAFPSHPSLHELSHHSLQELSESATYRRPQGAQEDAPRSDASTPEGSVPASGLRAAMLGRQRAGASSSPQAGSDMGRSLSSSDPTPAVVTVDLTSKGLPVLAVSAGFQMRVGRLPPDTRLLPLVEPGSLTEFIDWLKAAARQGGSRPAGRVTLKLRQGRVKASVSVFQESEGEALRLERFPLHFGSITVSRSPNDDPRGVKPHTSFRGTPREQVRQMAL